MILRILLPLAAMVVAFVVLVLWRDFPYWLAQISGATIGMLVYMSLKTLGRLRRLYRGGDREETSAGDGG